MTIDIPVVSETIPVTDALTFVATDEHYVGDPYQLVVKNRHRLQ